MAPFVAAARQLVALGPRFHSRGWVLGTSGNFSAVVSTRPLRLAITASSVDKGALVTQQVLLVDETGKQVAHAARENGRRDRRARSSSPSTAPLKPSAETLLHVEVVRRRGAAAVLHTHSVWSTTLSDLHFARGGLEITGYEMLKGLAGVRTHDHREWIPIIANDQNINRLAERLGETLNRETGAHALLLHRHGLYTWGESIEDAVRHVEILEFLFETMCRTRAIRGLEVDHGTAQDP